MCEHIRRSSRDPVLARVAVQAVRQHRGGPLYVGRPIDLRDPRIVAESCYWFAKHHMRFVLHDEMIRVMFGEHDQMQLLISPALLIRMRKMEGDCAIYTMLIAAMLQSQGVPFEIVTVAVDPSQPGVFSHVYPRVVLPQGRMPLDASHGDYPGWEVPVQRQSKRQVWSESGSPISDQASRWSGLHGYAMARRQGLGACGVDPLSGESWGDCSTTGTGTSSWIQNLSSDLARQWSQLGVRLLAQRGGVQQDIYMPTAGGGGSLQLLSNQASMIPGWVWIAGIGLVAILVLKKK